MEVSLQTEPFTGELDLPQVYLITWPFKDTTYHYPQGGHVAYAGEEGIELGHMPL